MTASPAEVFLGAARAQGYDFFTGVPCSLLKHLFAAVERLEPP